MTDITQLIQSGSAYVWLYIPVAIALGALHGLEPGHSKTMMAAFIIAVRGTIGQAVLLGLSAAISHSLLIWILAALALNFGGQWQAEQTEPYFHLASAALILGLAIWMFVRTRREVAEAHAHAHAHQHQKDEPAPKKLVPVFAPPTPEENPWQGKIHTHGSATAAPRLLVGESMTSGGLILPAGTAAPETAAVRSAHLGPHQGILLDTGHGWLEVAIQDSRFRIYPCKASGETVPLPKSTKLAIETARLDGGTQKFQMEARDTFWQATAEVPKPHAFLAVITLGHSDHAHTYRLRFTDDPKTPAAAAVEEPEDDGIEYQDAHERAHAQDIARRFGNRAVTTPQIILFGITGGLMPCPAAFTILLVCLQIEKVALGFSLVAAFSFGLALTMVIVGVIAAWSVQKAQRRYSGFGEWMRRAPYISCAVLVLLAAFMAWQGWQGLSHPHVH